MIEALCAIKLLHAMSEVIATNESDTFESDHSYLKVTRSEICYILLVRHRCVQRNSPLHSEGGVDTHFDHYDFTSVAINSYRLVM